MSQTAVEAIYPASAQQQGMLFETMAAPAAGVHVEQLTCRVEGDLDLPAFERAWRSLLERHAVLRTAFAWQDQPQPLQIVVRDAALPLAHLDWRGVPPPEVEVRLQALLDADRGQGFRMSKAPLMRLKLLQTGERSRLLVWTHHHILMDGWCRPVLLRELFTLYEAWRLGAEPALPPSLPYRDYIAWLGRQDTAQAEAYWRRELRQFHRPTALGRPAGAAEAGDPRGGYATVQRRLPAAETAALQALAQALRVTLSTVAQAAWALLLSRYSGELDVVFGVTVSGRPAELSGIESAIGLFINTLPLRVRIDPDASCATWLEGLQARDQIFGKDFVDQVKALGIKQVLSAPRSPWQRAYVERLIGSIRRECLDHVIVFGERSLHRTLTAYCAYYHRWRTHLSLGKDAPQSRRIQPPAEGAVVETS